MSGMRVVCGQAPAPSFDVVTVKPSDPEKPGLQWKMDHNLTVISGITVQELLRNAYELRTPGQVIGGPEWMRTERFDITAKMSDAEYRRQSTLSGYEGDHFYGALLQSLLKERFGVVASPETRMLPGYSLVLAGKSVDTKLLMPSKLNSDGKPVNGRRASGRNGHIVATGVTMNDLAEMLSGRFEVERMSVVNKTGLTGGFDFKLDYAPDSGMGVAEDAVDPTLADALRFQLGLRLKKEDGPVPVVVLTAVHRPEFD